MKKIFLLFLVLGFPLFAIDIPSESTKAPDEVVPASEENQQANQIKKALVSNDLVQPSAQKKKKAPDHLMIGPGIFNVDKTHRRWMAQIEYRFDPNCHHVRPLISFFATTDGNFYLCGGVGYDIFIGKRFVVTPSFAPGWYHQGHGRKLGFPLNFRSGIEAAFVFKNQGRLGAQFNHISNARMLLRNPGVDSLIFYYAIPLY